MQRKWARPFPYFAFASALAAGASIAIACADADENTKPPDKSLGCIDTTCYDAQAELAKEGGSSGSSGGPNSWPDPLAGTSKNATLVKGGFQFAEGPVWISGKLLFTDQKASPSLILELYPDGGTGTWRSGVNQTNGLAVNPVNGELIACEHGTHRVTKSPPVPGNTGNQARVTIANAWDGKPLNSPNDAIVRLDGNIYFTDPDYAADPDAGFRQDKKAVFRISPSGELSRLKETDSLPNGIALSPDGNNLYVVDNQLNRVDIWDLAADGTAINERKFVDTGEGPDGMAVDLAGNIYVASTPGIEVFDKTAKKLGVITVAGKATNCTFGGSDGQTLYITANTSGNQGASGLYSIKLNVPGLP
jgi:gluconolactonase